MIIVLVLTGALSLVVLYGIRLLSTARRLVGFSVIAVAVAGIVLVWDPDLSTRLANLVGVGRGTDLLVYLLFILTAMLVLLVHARFRTYDRMITELARSVSIAHVQEAAPARPAGVVAATMTGTTEAGSADNVEPA